MKRIFISLLSIVALCSCSKSIINEASQSEIFTISASPYDGTFNTPETKSANFEDVGNKVTDFNIWVYDSVTGKLVNGDSYYKTYFTNPNEVNGYYLFPDFNKKYDIYIISNFGKLDAPKNSSYADSYRYTFESYDTFKTTGFPMANRFSFVPSDPSINHCLQLKRLVSRFSLKFKFSEDNDYEFNLKSVVVRNSAKVISPFAEESKANNDLEVFKVADYLSPAELTSEGGDIYMIENIQGEVFNAPNKRSPYNMKKDAYKCTSYLEFLGEVHKKDGTSGFDHVKCRYYFGEGKFAGVKRNYNTPIILTMTNSFLENDDWTVEPIDPYTKAYIKFNDFGPVTWATDPVNLLSLNSSNKKFRMFGRAFVDNAFADNIKYKYVFDKEALKRAGVTLKVFYPTDGGLKSSEEYGKGPSTLVFSTGDISLADSDIEFTAVDEYGAVLGKFNTKISIIPEISVDYYDLDISNAQHNGGSLTFRYNVNVAFDGITLDPAVGDYTVEIIDWGYDYKDGKRIPYDFEGNICDYSYEYKYQKDLAKIDIDFIYQYGYHHDYDNSYYLLLNVILKNGRKYQAECKEGIVKPNPDPIPKHSGLYYLYEPYKYKPMDRCGTYSSDLGVDTSSYDGECYYYSSFISVDYSENGAIYPVISGGRETEFKYYENDVEKSIKLSVSSPKIIWKNIRRTNRTGSQYPYHDGRYIVGSHKSYVIITVTFPDNHQKKYWGYISETDEFGGLFKYLH